MHEKKCWDACFDGNLFRQQQKEFFIIIQTKRQFGSAAINFSFPKLVILSQQYRLMDVSDVIDEMCSNPTSVIRQSHDKSSEVSNGSLATSFIPMSVNCSLPDKSRKVSDLRFAAIFSRPTSVISIDEYRLNDVSDGNFFETSSASASFTSPLVRLSVLS